MRKLLLLPLLFGLVSPAIAHNEFNGGCGNHCVAKSDWKSNPGVNSNSTNTQIKIINEENSQSSSIASSNDKKVDDSKLKKVDDSKINLKTTAERKNSMALYIVIAILITIIPLVTWRYFTK